MAGWDLKCGLITKYDLDEEYIWSLFNYVFSDECRKRNTYKFGLIKAILDNVFSGKAKNKVSIIRMSSYLLNLQKTIGI